MTVSSPRDLQEQIDRLNGRLRRLQLTIVGIAVGAIGLLVVTGISAQGPAALRVRSLIVEDANGKDRVILGAPLPDTGRISSATGLVINDENGVERFGVSLLGNGNMNMGFDAPPGTGDPRNRERVTLGADAKGSGYVRFLNRKTQVPGRLVLDDSDQFYLEFLDFQDGKVTSKRIGFKGEETGELQP